MAIISAANLKTHLGLADDLDDATIGYAVNAANQAIVEWCGRTFDKTATGSASARVYWTRNTVTVDIDDTWETSVLAVKTSSNDDGTYDQTWVLNTDYIVEPLNGLRHGQTWPYTSIRAVGSLRFPTCTDRPGVQVTAAWGWTSVPSAVFEATLIKAARLWKRKNSPEGVLAGWSEYGAVRVSRNEDPDVIGLLGPFVHPSRAAVLA